MLWVKSTCIHGVQIKYFVHFDGCDWSNFINFWNFWNFFFRSSMQHIKFILFALPWKFGNLAMVCRRKEITVWMDLIVFVYIVCSNMIIIWDLVQRSSVCYSTSVDCETCWEQHDCLGSWGLMWFVKDMIILVKHDCH